MLHAGPELTPEQTRALPRRGGYRNLFGTSPGGPATADGALSGEFFQEYGKNTEDILIRLARCLEKPYAWPKPVRKGLRRDENPEIPAGYTYLAQFVAHDLSFLGSSLTPLEASPADERNLRALALNLETIYGGGPLERPSSYCFESDGSPRRRLRLGLLQEEIDGAADNDLRRKALSRDLPRAACPDLRRASGAEKRKGETHPGEWLTEVLISDPRNDDHLLVAQTAVLFHLLHNHVCERIAANQALHSPEHADEHGPRYLSGRNLDIFSSARRIVTKIYRDIVREDLMRRLLCEPVYRRYADPKKPLLDTSRELGMPVEFSHAAFRVGHAMVQPGYQIRHEVEINLEDLLRFNSQLLFDRMPPNWNWIVRWSNFYDIMGTPVNLSRRIGPSQNHVLVTSPLIGVGDDPLDPQSQTGLPRRDLLRSGLVGCRSVESLIRHIRRNAPDLLAHSPYLRDEAPDARRKLVLDFLEAQEAQGNVFSEKERMAIAADPPLVLFCLLEAAAEQDGLHLGVLGSVIIAEVIFRALREAEAEDKAKSPKMKTMISAALGYDPDRMARRFVPMKPPRSMPDLIRFLGDLPFLQGQEPLFV
jgi:hypothetical protein